MNLCRELIFFTENTASSRREMSRPRDEKMDTLIKKRQSQSAAYASTAGGMLSKEKFANGIDRNVKV